MKHIKKFEDISFNIEEAIAKIESEFSEMRVAEMLDDEILNWIDSD
jgi:hypothetical protein